MTQAEFKAWFEGFTEAIEKAPTQKQWARIKERVAEIDGTPVTERIYVDRYVRPYERWWYYPTTYPSWVTYGAGDLTAGSVTTSNTTQAAFNSAQAMYALGSMEAQSQGAQ